MNEKLKALLKRMGYTDAQIAAYSETDPAKLDALVPDADADAVVAKIKDVYKNEIEPNIKKVADASARAHLYTEFEGQLAKEGGFKREDIVAAGIAEPKLSDFVAHFKKVTGKEPGEGSKKLQEIQEEARQSALRAEAAEKKALELETNADKKLDEYKAGLKKTGFVHNIIGKFEKKPLVPAEKAWKLIGEDIESKYAIILDEKGEYDIREKADPTVKIKKSLTEYLTLKDVIAQKMEEDGLFAKSNAKPGKTAPAGGGEDDEEEDGEKGKKFEKKLPASALALEKAHEEAVAKTE